MNWRSEYAKKKQTAEQALESVRSGMRVYIQPGCAEPETLVEALLKRGPFVRNVEVVHLLTLGNADYVKPEMEGHFRHNAIFIGGNVREAVNDGRADYTPVYLSEVEPLFESGAMPLDVGAALQTGSGGVPDAVLPFLVDRKDLGVHTELVADCVIPLIEAGVIPGNRKNYKPRKIILGFVLGSKELFDFVDNNPIFEFHHSSYTNDPGLIARNDNMVAINSAL